MATNTRTTAENNGPHPLDVALGARIRLRRREIGVTQVQLSGEVGITFQQVQKYEHGTNRVSFSRLVEIATALKCSVSDLVGGLDKPSDGSTFSRHLASLNEPGAIELLGAYTSIQEPKHRRAVLALALQMAEGE